MAKYPSQLQDKFNLRLPDGMKDEIAERAKANGRSINSEIVQILQDALENKSFSRPEIDLKNIDSKEFAIELKNQVEKKQKELTNALTLFLEAVSDKNNGQ